MNASIQTGTADGTHRPYSEASLLVAGGIVAFALSLLFLPATPKSAADIEYEARAKRLRDIAVVSDFPVDERMSRVSCSRSGSGRDACLESETALRPQAAALWQAADKYRRLRCIGGSERAPGPAGYLFACLSTLPYERPHPE